MFSRPRSAAFVIMTFNQELELKQACLEARELSYSPYSKFRVGAAVLYADGSIVKGANVENASYGAGVCAERSALITARMIPSEKGGKTRGEIKAVAVTSDVKDLVSPCGICRQFIREFAALNTPIYMYNCEGELTKRTLEELLPLSFGPSNLI